MASGNCFFCGLGTAEFMAGWKLKDGSNAKLCINCGSRYANGTFCQTFHHGAEGWRDCSLCQKPLHCGCAISCHIIELLDFGGVACTGCLLRLERKISAAKVRRNTLAQIDADTHPLVPDKGLPKMTSQEQLEEVAENSSSYATLLFQKKLTPSDTYLGNARLVLPIKEAELGRSRLLS